MRFSVTIDRDQDGVWVVECPSIPICVSQGGTKDDALDNICDAIQLCLQNRAERGLAAPSHGGSSTSPGRCCTSTWAARPSPWRWLKDLTGAAAATPVNNNATTVFLMLNTLALRKDVVVSRGELVETAPASTSGFGTLPAPYGQEENAICQLLKRLAGLGGSTG